jgi:hypothetical protein
MSGERVHSWGIPVVLALDAEEKLPGFRADQVEWDFFRFWRMGRGEQMQTASIYAYPTGTEHEFVRFAVTDGEFTVTDPQGRRMTADEVADALNVPTASAEKAVTLVVPALATVLARFNAVYAPRAATQAVTTAQAPVGSYNRRSGPADQGERPGIGL